MHSALARAPKAPAGELTRAISIELRRAARTARASRPVTSGGAGFRTRAIDRFFSRFVILSFVLIFALPALFCVAYYSYVAADQFVTEARFAIRSGKPSGIESLAGVSDLLDTGQAKDGLIIAEYVRSSALVQELAARFDFPKIFARRGLDFWEALDSQASAEELLKFWRSKVDINVDRSSGLVTLNVRAFTAQESFGLAQAIIQSSEGMVNRLTRRNDDDAFNDSKKELERTKGELERAVAELRDARNSVGIIDVDVAAKTYGELVTALRLQLSAVELSIQTLMREDAKNAPQLVALNARAKTLRDQISQYESRMAGRLSSDADDGNLADRASVLFDKETERDIAQAEYKSAVASYELARTSLDKQRSYLLEYVTPRLAEEALYPRRVLMIAAIIGAAFILWATIVGLGFLVRDHMAT